MWSGKTEKENRRISEPLIDGRQGQGENKCQKQSIIATQEKN